LSAAQTKVSLILETVNLELADLAGLRHCLDSISKQSLDLTDCEILMVESGEVPEEALRDLQGEYPWLNLHQVPPGMGYEEAKMTGVEVTSGEIVAFFDADCIYEKDWLRNLINDGLLTRPDLGVLGGETMIDTGSVWGITSSLLFSFNFYSTASDIYNYERFHFNNVAFRREVLQQHPIPTRQPLFRTSTMLYSMELREAGIEVGRQPRSRALHAAPNGWRHFFWRYLMFGHDAAGVLKLARKRAFAKQATLSEGGRPLNRLWHLARNRLRTISRRASFLLREQPRRWLYLPVVLPLVGTGLLLMTAGYLMRGLSSELLPAIMPSEIKRGSSFADRSAT